jgi:hypothetical protein
LHFHDDADASYPSDGPAIVNADLTDAVAWNNVEAWSVYGNWYNSVDVASILQDVIDLGGWGNGNAVVLQMRSNGSTNYRNWSTYDYSSGNYKPELHVKWIP